MKRNNPKDSLPPSLFTLSNVGAANLEILELFQRFHQGHYQGISAFISEQSPTEIHVWYYAHILSPMLADTTGSVVESASLIFWLKTALLQCCPKSHTRICRGER